MKEIRFGAYARRPRISVCSVHSVDERNGRSIGMHYAACASFFFSASLFFLPNIFCIFLFSLNNVYSKKYGLVKGKMNE